MKKYFVFLILSVGLVNVNAQVDDVEGEEIVVTAPAAKHRPVPAPAPSRAQPEVDGEEAEIVVTGPSRRRASIYTPQQAIEDTLSEPLTFVGRGIPDPIRDSNNVIITEGASQYCVFKNSKVYVVHQGCRPSSRQDVSVLVMEVYRRSGQSIRFYAEPNSASYSLSSIGSNFSGSWNITLQRTPAINGDLNLESFFGYMNTQNHNTNLGSCVYGRPAALSGDARLLCVGMPEQTSFSEAAAAAYSSPSSVRFNEFHDAIRFHSRNSN